MKFKLFRNIAFSKTKIYRSISILPFSIDSFPIEMYGFMNLCVDIDPVHGLTKMCKRSIFLYHSMSRFFFAYGIVTPFGSIH
ncbi:hypothetical protein V6Z12_D09G041300 [Gossypium hirsutum]